MKLSRMVWTSRVVSKLDIEAINSFVDGITLPSIDGISPHVDISMQMLWSDRIYLRRTQSSRGKAHRAHSTLHSLALPLALYLLPLFDLVCIPKAVRWVLLTIRIESVRSYPADFKRDQGCNEDTMYK